MPNYEEIVRESQRNVNALNTKINELDELYRDIKELTKQPEFFNEKFQEIVELSQKYTNDLGIVTKEYLDGNNILFTEKLKEFSNKISELQKGIDHLVNTDFNKSFQKLQDTFIEQTKKDIAKELIKFDEKLKILQTKIEALKVQVERLERIDLEKHFNVLQKNLSDIFGSISSINLILTNIIQTLHNISQSLGDIQTSIDNNQKEIKQYIEQYHSDIEKHLENQDKKVSIIKDKIDFLEIQNNSLRKENRMLTGGLCVFVLILIGLLFYFL
ncbi:MAG: hypothetical protein LBG80_16215 [Bacteroidales bacterium]|jgi:methyl-accepting chemotaxis protein|nr:hypothetical protein [Bacteroidales bacterium]